MAPEISDKQLAANRRNATRSTGPRTPEGKARVKWNALKHGLLARSVVVPLKGGPENRRQFKALLEQLHEEMHPVGMIEEMLVEQIAVAYWRRRRALRAEAGEITDNVLDSRRYGSEFHPGTLALPSKSDTYKIVRYEAAIDRQLHRSVNQLERLQNRRQRNNHQLSENSPIDKN